MEIKHSSGAYVIPGLKVNTVDKEELRIHILAAVNQCTGHTLESLKIRSRKSALVLLRFVVFKLWKDQVGLHLTEIGDFFDMDHTSVIHGLKRINDLLDTKDPAATLCYKQILSKI